MLLSEFMELEIKYSRLFRYYGKVLTPIQQDITEMYYAFDLSLSEIAEIKNVTRQSVEYTLRTARRTLDGYEKNIGFAELIDKLYNFADTLTEDKRKDLIEILEK